MLNARAPNALASIKELLSEADQATLNRQLAAERDHFVRNLHHAATAARASPPSSTRRPRATNSAPRAVI
jgi:enoyl-CoA hydratase/carnithine racemase